VTRRLPAGFELDDNRDRIDVDAVHAYLSQESYWARGRSYLAVASTVRQAARVVGLYHGDRQVGFARVLSDNVHIAYLCDVYVLSLYRGRGLGVDLVREAVDNGPQRSLQWWLATQDAHGLYRRFGFAPADDRRLIRPAGEKPSRLRRNDVRLEPLDEQWRDDVADLVDDPEVLRFTRVPDPPPQEYARSWISKYAAGRAEGTREGFAAVDDSGRFVGLGLATIDRAASQLELGYIVARAARGQGVATQILHLLTQWAFQELQAQRVLLIVNVENHASQRVAERCGYRREGVMRSIQLKRGKRIDATLWSRLPTDPEPPPSEDGSRRPGRR
jgi:RimJ/RimL family protein N-acetyltransferase